MPMFKKVLADRVGVGAVDEQKLIYIVNYSTSNRSVSIIKTSVTSCTYE